MMKRGKGICAAVMLVLTVGMTGAVVSASADAGGRDNAISRSAVAVVADANPAAQDGNPGNSRGAGGGPGSGDGNSSPAAQVGPSSGNGNSQGGGSGGSGGDPQGGDGGRGGNPTPSSGSGGSDTGAQRNSSGSGSVSGGSGGAQGPGAPSGRGSGSNGGSGSNSGSGSGTGSSGSGGGNSVGGQSGRCSTGCHVGQQPGTPGTVTFTPAPTQGQSSSSQPTGTTPAVTPPPVTTPVVKPTTGRPTSTTYSTTATQIAAGKHSPTVGLVGLGTTVSPAARAGTVATSSRLSGQTPSAIANLIGGRPTIETSHSGHRRTGAPTRPAAETQPIAQQTFIGGIEQVIPPVIWLALAAAFAVGGLSAGYALYSGHRVRRQAGALAAMSTAALTDQLTGVLNRRGFLEAVERELARARRYERGFVLAYVDVRGLKGVNDTEGHRAGDELLKEAASLLQDSARADDVVGRLGGDEMGLLLVEQGTEGADAVRSRVAAEVPARREKLGLHSSWDLTIGTAAYPEDGDTVDDLLRVADLRLYEQRGIDLLDRAPAV